MKRKAISPILGVLLTLILTACGGAKTIPTSVNSEAEARIAQLEQELEELNSQQQEGIQQSTGESDDMLTTTMEAPETSGICGQDLTWYYKNGVLAITGTGEMTDYDIIDKNESPYDTPCPWNDIKDKICWVIINEGVTTVGRRAFYRNESLSKVILPDTLTTIRKSAFSGCKNLKEIDLPDSITTIENAAFYECGLKKVEIPDSVTTIGNSVFSRCSSLDEVTLPNSLTTIGYDTFQYGGNVIYNGQTYTWGEFSNMIEESWENVLVDGYHVYQLPNSN